MSTAAHVAGFLSGVLFGYIVNFSGSYERPLILMAVVLGFGALMWLKIDPTRRLISETTLQPRRIPTIPGTETR